MVTRRTAISLGLVLLATGCFPDEEPDVIEGELGVAVQSLRTAPNPGGQGTLVAMEMIATNGQGKAIACDDAELDLDVEVAFDGGPFESIDPSSLNVQCGSSAHDFALVVDNSGSQQDVLETTRQAAKTFVSDVLDDGGRVSVVRVSTFASVLSELTDDQTQLDDALDSMFINKGWTSLYDGIRMGNETLGAELGVDDPGAFQSADAFCDKSPFGIVAFSNGNDNNSAEEELSGVEGDGFDTTLDDLKALSVNAIPTPIHTIGLGKRLNTPLLKDLSNSTGGKNLTVRGQSNLAQAYNQIKNYGPSTNRICASTPGSGCGQAVVRVQYTYNPQGAAPFSSSNEYNVNVPCPIEGVAGRVATILLTLSDPGIAQGTAETLVENTLNWVNPRDDQVGPSVLFVRDDNHRDEDAGDVAYIQSLADAAGFSTAYEDEPDNGHNIGHYDAYDIVWFSNPGWPIDDASTFQALLDFAANGGGVVLSGDDMSWSMGNGFPTTSLTRLNHISNGTQTCGKKTDNNEGESYRVDLDSTTHPVIAGLEGATFTYGNDIDHSDSVGVGEVVLASATLDSDPSCDVEVPVIVAYDPE